MRNLIIGATLTLASLFSGSAIAQEVNIPRHAQIEMAKFVCNSVAQGYSRDYIFGRLNATIVHYYQNEGSRMYVSNDITTDYNSSQHFNDIMRRNEKEKRAEAIIDIVALADEKQCQF